MARVDFGDLSRWLVREVEAETEGGVGIPFELPAEGARVRVDLVASSEGGVSIRQDDESGPVLMPFGVYDPRAGILRLDFVASGRVVVGFDTAHDCIVAMRRYDDHYIIETDDETFTTYDPANFYVSDVDRMNQLMRINQERFMQNMERHFNERMRKLQEKEASNGSEDQEREAPDPEGGEAGDDGETAEGGDAETSALNGASDD